MDAALYGVFAIGLAVPVLLLLVLVVRAQWEGRRVDTPAAVARASEHAAMHHAIWLPVAQELGLPVKVERIGSATRRHLAGARRAVGLALDVFVPWAFASSLWKRLDSDGGLTGASEAELDALEDLRIVVDAPMDMPLPAGLRVGLETKGSQALHYLGVHDVQTGDPALDDRVRGDDRAAVRALVSDPRVRTALARLARIDQAFSWTPDTVRLTVQPHRVHRFRPALAREYADACAGLVLAARARQAAPWAPLTRALGLTAAKGGLRGEVSGVLVELETGFDTAIVRVHVGPSLRALRLAAEDPGGPGDPIKFPNPVLSAALKGRTQDKFLARRVLSDEPTATALVAVLRGTRGASLVDGVLRLPLGPGAAAEETVRAAVKLARRLVRAAR